MFMGSAHIPTAHQFANTSGRRRLSIDFALQHLYETIGTVCMYEEMLNTTPLFVSLGHSYPLPSLPRTAHTCEMTSIMMSLSSSVATIASLLSRPAIVPMCSKASRRRWDSFDLFMKVCVYSKHKYTKQ